MELRYKQKSHENLSVYICENQEKVEAGIYRATEQAFGCLYIGKF